MRARQCSDDEFPLLSGLGLYAAEILGDGNCLFNALSDQIYGHQNSHWEIRARTVQYMRNNASEFKAFISVNSGGGVRRNPKRKNVGAYSTPYSQQAPTEEEIEQTFQRHLDTMAKGGAWGDNVEIQAFARAYNLTVKIYHRDFAYYVTPFQDGLHRDVVHIAYHSWEHYSSIRNLDGPDDGPPKVCDRAISPGTEAAQQIKLATAPYVHEWQVDFVMDALPFIQASRLTVWKALEKNNGSIDKAVSDLLDDDPGSQSSAHESSSIEREPDSDDDELYGPNKRRNRSTARQDKPEASERIPRTRSSSSRALKTRGARRRAASSLSSHQPSPIDPVQLEATLDRHVSSPIPTSTPEPDAGSASHPVTDVSKAKTPSRSKTCPVRIRLTMPKCASEVQEANIDPNTTQTSHKQCDSQGRRLSARDKKDMKKQAQKAARRERQQHQAAAQSTTARTLPIMTKPNHASPSTLHAGIRVLYL